MPNGNTHDAITFALVPLTYLAAEMYWNGNHTISIIATAAMLFGPVIIPDHGLSRAVSCTSNLKQLSIAAMLYAQDCDDRLPLQRRWSDGLYPYVKTRSVYVCPKVSEERQSSIDALTAPICADEILSAIPSRALNVSSTSAEPSN